MKRWACMQTNKLVDGRAAGLSDGDRLRLEHHLGECASCRAESRGLGALRVVWETTPPRAVTERGRERAIQAALAAAGGGAPSVVARPARARTGFTWAIPTLALAGAAAAAMFVVQTDDDGAAPVAARAPIVAPAPVVDEAPAPVPAIPTLESGVELHASTATRVSVADAHIDIAAGAAVVWDADDSTLRLLDGALTAEVDPRSGRPFRVATPTFTVEVVGTKFAVSAEEVTVTEGSVRVLDPDGGVIEPSVTAGTTWRVEADIDTDEDVDMDTRPGRPSADASKLLTKARARLAAGDVDGARGIVERALKGRLGRRDTAEARTLLAECALVAGDGDEAMRLYLDVARRYAGLAAGQNALFAAARVALRNGDEARARKLFERYQKRYPQGRFAAETTEHLDRMEGN